MVHQPMSETPHDSVERIRHDFRAYVVWLREEGVGVLEMSPETLDLLDQPASAEAPSPGGPESAPPDGELAAIAGRIAGCTKCSLCRERTNTVPGQGSPSPELMFVGEGPGADEDKQGLAFVGRAGKLLTKIIEAMGMTRDEVFIANIVKCRPPGNRAPTPEEMESCLPYLREQIALLRPRVIVTLGATAAKGLLGTTQGITRLRGNWHSFEGIDTMPTYHPAYLLRNPAGKRPVWEDMQAVLARLGREPPAADTDGS